MTIRTNISTPSALLTMCTSIHLHTLFISALPLPVLLSYIWPSAGACGPDRDPYGFLAFGRVVAALWLDGCLRMPRACSLCWPYAPP